MYWTTFAVQYLNSLFHFWWWLRQSNIKSCNFIKHVSIFCEVLASSYSLLYTQYFEKLILSQYFTTILLFYIFRIMKTFIILCYSVLQYFIIFPGLWNIYTATTIFYYPPLHSRLFKHLYCHNILLSSFSFKIF